MNFTTVLTSTGTRGLPDATGLHSARRGGRLGITVAVLVAAGYLWVMLCFWAPAHPGVDQNGYLVGAKQLARTGSTALRLPDPYSFVGNMWVYQPRGDVYFPKYPLGNQLIYALALRCLGERPGDAGYVAAHLVSPVATAVAMLGMYAVTWLLTRSAFAGVGSMLLLGTSQLTMSLATNPNSHALATACVICGMAFLIRWVDRGGWLAGVLGGLLLGYAVLVRYTEGLLVLSIAVAMLVRLARSSAGVGRARSAATVGSAGLMLASLAVAIGLQAWVMSVVAVAAVLWVVGQRRWQAVLAGLAPLGAWLVPVIGQVVFTRWTMGHWTTYDSTNESAGFGVDYFVVNIEKSLRMMTEMGLFLVAPLGVVGVVAMLRRRSPLAWMLLAWFLPGFLLYSAYYWAPSGAGYARFFQTQYPALIAAAVWLIATARPTGPAAGLAITLAVGLLTAVTAAVGVARYAAGIEFGTTRQPAHQRSTDVQTLAKLGTRLLRVAPAGSMVFGDEPRLHHIQFVGDYSLYSINAFNAERVRSLLSRPRRRNDDDPDPLDGPRIAMLAAAYRGKDDAKLTAEAVRLIESAHAAGRRVFVVLPDKPADQWRNRIVRDRFEWVPRDRVSEPRPPLADWEKLDEPYREQARPRIPVTSFRNWNPTRAEPTARNGDGFVIAEIVPRTAGGDPTTTPG